VYIVSTYLIWWCSVHCKYIPYMVMQCTV